MSSFDSYYTLPEVRRLRRSLRKEATVAEKILWPFLRGRKMLGFKFRRQHSVGRFILDFYCSGLRLGIELDGGHHLGRDQLVLDKSRSEWLKHFRVKIIRIGNHEVMNNLDGVVEYLMDVVTKRKEEMRLPRPTATPSV